MNSQEIFDQIVSHLLTQNVKSQDGRDGMCLYRDEYGNKCSVGCLIPDEDYSAGMECLNVVDLLSRNDILSHLRPHVSLLSSMQFIHDEHEPHEWEGLFAQVAKNYNLVY